MSRHSSAVLTCAAGPTSSASSDASVSFKRFRGDAPIGFAIAVAVRRRAWNAQLAASALSSRAGTARGESTRLRPRRSGLWRLPEHLRAVVLLVAQAEARQRAQRVDARLVRAQRLLERLLRGAETRAPTASRRPPSESASFSLERSKTPLLVPLLRVDVRVVDLVLVREAFQMQRRRALRVFGRRLGLGSSPFGLLGARPVWSGSRGVHLLH